MQQKLDWKGGLQNFIVMLMRGGCASGGAKKPVSVKKKVIFLLKKPNSPILMPLVDV